MKSISIVFDEGQDTGPISSGSRCSTTSTSTASWSAADREKSTTIATIAKARTRTTGTSAANASQSRPEESRLSFADPVQGVNVQMINGARSVTYAGACVTFIGDALLNDDPGHVVSFTACDLSALSTPLCPASAITRSW